MKPSSTFLLFQPKCHITKLRHFTEFTNNIYDIIEPWVSSWSSPVEIVQKKDGRLRFCINFQNVNEVTEHDAYPLPQIHATLDKLKGAMYVTTLDLYQGYWQIPLAPENRAVTAFTVPGSCSSR